MRTKLERCILAFSYTVSFAILACLFVKYPVDALYRRWNTNRWKAAAIADISKWMCEPNWFKDEKGRLLRVGQSSSTFCGFPDSPDFPWFGSHLLIFNSREWIVYCNDATNNNWQFNNLFIGKASDGKWYYSEDDFGVGMNGVQYRQSESLKEFKEDHHLNEFSGSTTGDDGVR